MSKFMWSGVLMCAALMSSVASAQAADDVLPNPFPFSRPAASAPLALDNQKLETMLKEMGLEPEFLNARDNLTTYLIKVEFEGRKWNIVLGLDTARKQLIFATRTTPYQNGKPVKMSPAMLAKVNDVNSLHCPTQVCLNGKGQIVLTNIYGSVGVTQDALRASLNDHLATQKTVLQPLVDAAIDTAL